jgi:putative CocE/NonD family hydrolase
MRSLIFLFLSIWGSLLCAAQQFVRDNYNKREVYIPMRDGVRLFTSIYIPKDQANGPYPFLMERTPYGAGPYGDSVCRSGLGPNAALSREPFIFVYQDVRGRYMSEGSFQEMTPHKENKKTGDRQTDESSDTWDTIEWLLKNISGNNGRVGIWGISYPGFYASASLPDAHPAIKAVSPQAPVTDEFIGDDANHNGAFFLLDNFDFDNFFDVERPAPVTDYGHNLFNADIRDAYQFFLDIGPIRNTNSPEYFNNKGKIWNEYLAHSTYDAYWQARNIRPHLKNIRPAVLVVGGWFDAEDMFGALRTYEAIERQSPHNDNHIIMGPWTHGGWSAESWQRYGDLEFGQNVNACFHQLETSFFNHYLKDSADPVLREATVFETGTNQWKYYDTWPPAQAHATNFYLQAGGLLSKDVKPVENIAYDEYVSDPAHPVPYIDGVRGGRDNEYIVTDQRFAAKRPDVLTYQTDFLRADLPVTGRLRANIFLSSTGTDADLVIKIIDVLPDGYQRLVRAEVFRCKFRKSFADPEPLIPGKITEVAYDLNEIAHTFKEGHRLMVQIQSSWFPLVDRNPQTFVNIPTCSADDFRKATIRIYHDATHLSSVTLPVITP